MMKLFGRSWFTMLRTCFILIVIAMLVGCTSSPVSSPNLPDPTATGAEPASVEETLTSAATAEQVFHPTSEINLTPEATPTSENTLSPSDYSIQEYPLPSGTRPHDVAPAADGSIWYTGQHVGALGRLNPVTGETHHIPLGSGSAPHGVIVGPDGAPWITDSGLNAILRVDPQTEAVQTYSLPPERGGANLNTAVFDKNNILWFTGQNGIYGSLDPSTGSMQVFDAPRGRGPYGITSTPDGMVYYASLANSYVGFIDPQTGEAEILEPPTSGQGARRVWSDSLGRVWVSEWNAGQVAVYDPSNNSWREWELPGDRPQAYAVYVDDQDIVWLSNFGSNSLVRFDPGLETFTVYELPSPNAAVRQILGRPGEVWGAESGTDKLVVIRTASP